MLLGKRHRLPSTIRRTTSMSGITVYNDPLSPVDASSESDPPADQILGDLHATVGPEHASFVNHVSDSNNDSSNYNVDSFGNKNNFDHLYDNRFLTSMVSPRYGSSRIGGGSGGFVETAHFLRTCGLCKRRLAPGKDIYMYRGETAFCSRECREQQIKQDEVKEKCRVMELSTREDRDTSPPPPPPPPPSSSSSSPSSTRSSKASPLSERRLWLLLDPHDELID